MRGWFGARAATFLAIVCVCGALAPQTAAVNITIDYSFDTNNFFSSQVRRDALQAAADFYSDILEDTLVGGTIPSRVTSTVDDGYWEWQLRFTNPSTGAAEIVTSATLAQDEYLIYAGGRPLGGNTLGQGGPGGFAFGRFNNQGEFDDTIQFASNQFPTINQGNSDFQAGFVDRGETDGFVRWGGALTFDSDGSTNWHFGIESGPTSSGQSDFLSVALHELGHTLGLGASSEWTSLVNSGRFQGPAAIAANGGIAPPADFGHWQEGTQSTIYGTFTRQEAALDPIITSGTRKLVTTLDAAGLDDIGWDVADPGLLPGDYNFDGTVNAADYTVWRDSLKTGAVVGSYAGWKANFGSTASGQLTQSVTTAGVPEPAAVLVCCVAMLALISQRRRLC